MMTQLDRLQEIETRLKRALTPSYLEIIDDSADHLGHSGAQMGAGHYTVVIQSPHFSGKSKVAAHQLVYQALADLIPHEIHALVIQIKAV